MGDKIVQVIVNNNSYQTDKLFDYRVPAHLYDKVASISMDLSLAS